MKSHSVWTSKITVTRVYHSREGEWLHMGRVCKRKKRFDNSDALGFNFKEDHEYYGDLRVAVCNLYIYIIRYGNREIFGRYYVK